MPTRSTRPTDAVSRDAMRALLSELAAAPSGKLWSATFIKKDGTLRRLLVQQGAGAKLIKGTGADATAKASSTAPNIKRVFDFVKKEWRSLNLDTVVEARVSGTTYVVVQQEVS